MIGAAQTIASGLAQGAEIALAAAGVVLIYRRWAVLSLVQGGLLALGAHAAYATESAGAGIWLGVAAAVAASAAAGGVSELALWGPLRRRGVSGDHVSLCALGVALTIGGLLRAGWPDGPRMLGVHDRRAVTVLGADLGHWQLIGLGAALLGGVLVALVGRRGVPARATAARSWGAAGDWALAGALAGLAGALVVLREGAQPELTIAALPAILAAAALARLSSVLVAVVAGLAVGLVQAVVVELVEVPGGGPTVAVGILMAVLMLAAARAPRLGRVA